MRKSARSLALIAQNEMKLNPFTRSLFVFCSRSRRILKVLAWDGNGWLEVIKRIESRERFFWPMDNKEARGIDADMLIGTLKGYDMWRPFKQLTPMYVG